MGTIVQCHFLTRQPTQLLAKFFGINLTTLELAKYAHLFEGIEIVDSIIEAYLLKSPDSLVFIYFKNDPSQVKYDVANHLLKS